MLHIYPFYSLDHVPKSTRVHICNEVQLNSFAESHVHGGEFILITDNLGYGAKRLFIHMNDRPALFKMYVERTPENVIILNDLLRDTIGVIYDSIDTPESITALPPMVDQTKVISTLDDLTTIIRSLNNPTPIYATTHADYDDYVKTLEHQAKQVAELAKRYENANRWVKLLNASNWSVEMIGLVKRLIGSDFTAPTYFTTTDYDTTLVWSIATPNLCVGVHLKVQINNEAYYGDWLIANDKVEGFRYKPYTETLLNRYFATELDRVDTLNLVNAAHPDMRGRNA